MIGMTVHHVGPIGFTCDTVESYNDETGHVLLSNGQRKHIDNVFLTENQLRQSLDDFSEEENRRESDSEEYTVKEMRDDPGLYRLKNADEGDALILVMSDPREGDRPNIALCWGDDGVVEGLADECWEEDDTRFERVPRFEWPESLELDVIL